MNLESRYDLLSEDEAREYFLQLNGPEGWTREQKEQHLDVRLKKQSLADLSRELNAFKREVWPPRFGVFCTSTLYNEIVMWSHYAKSHEGFCVGFDLNILNECFNTATSRGLIFFARQVTYSTDANIYIAKEKEQQLQQSTRSITTKFERWSYESEVRITVHRLTGDPRPLTDNDRRLDVPESAIKEVILGYKMHPHHRDAIKSVLRSYSNRPKLYRIEIKTGAFELARTEVHY